MAKKLTKKRAATKKAPKRNLKTKKVEKSQEDNSTGIMLLAGIGLILLIYFGSTVSVDIDMDVKTTNDAELIDNSIIISGKTYSSKSEAKKRLTGIPQSQLTDEEIKFVEGYQE